ncbi:DUF4232 domain-containing protein [Streptomyces sp. NPDC048419]|uniref:DUF4232 domain-containing protein n=1 Tax=Streptomyces sp. NPDC048419 TaxID=3365547 RepID=UPI00371D1458
MRVRTSIAAAAVLAAGLTMTACQNDDKAAGGETTGSTASAQDGSATPTASAPVKGTGSGTPSAGGTGGSAQGGDGTIAACTTRTTKAAFVAAARHATQSKPATGTVKITNTSSKPCTIVGASSLVAKDDQGKSEPIEVDNHAAGTDAVDVAPGATAAASVNYTDLNFEGTESARETCGVQASKVEIALPKDAGRTVQVTSAKGSAAVFNVCGTDVKFGAFRA